MGTAASVSTHKSQSTYTISVRKPEGNCSLRDLGVDGRIILKLII
jgi:hypothetical protein